MARTTSITLLFGSILLLTVVFRFVIFISFIESQKDRFRSILAQQASNELTRLTIPLEDLFKNKNGIEWNDHNKEVIIGGIYYEVLATSFKGPEVEIVVMADDTENELFRRYFEISNEKNKLMKNLFSLIFGVEYLSTDPASDHVQPAQALSYLKPVPFELPPGHHLPAIKPPLL